MNWVINPANSQPIYQQLSHQIRLAVVQGRLLPDEQLPSVRELSKLLVVNPNTIARTYTELERDGVLYTRPGLGVFVARPTVEQSKAIRWKKLEDMLESLLTDAVYLGFQAEEVQALVAKKVKAYQWNLTQKGPK